MSGAHKPLAAPLVGLLLFIASFPLLWWNEGVAVRDYLTIGDLGKKTVEASTDQVDPETEGLPIHLVGDAQTTTALSDPQFGVEVTALRLRRTVEMYQWEEDRPSQSEEEKGEQTTYKQVWSSEPISSKGFEDAEGHANPPMPDYRSESWTADEAMIGVYQLPKFLIEKLSVFTKANVDAVELPVPEAKPIGNGFFLGADPNRPEIGDIRIVFDAVYPQEVSLIAVQKGNALTEFKSEKTGRAWSVIQAGTHDIRGLIQIEKGKVKLRTWILRALGFGCMFFGLMFVLQPMRSMVGGLPFLGRVLDAGIVVINLLTAASLSLVVIIIAWFAHRPLLAIGLGVVLLVLLFLLFKLIGSRQKRK